MERKEEVEAEALHPLQGQEGEEVVEEHQLEEQEEAVGVVQVLLQTRRWTPLAGLEVVGVEERLDSPAPAWATSKEACRPWHSGDEGGPWCRTEYWQAASHCLHPRGHRRSRSRCRTRRRTSRRRLPDGCGTCARAARAPGMETWGPPVVAAVVAAVQDDGTDSSNASLSWVR